MRSSAARIATFGACAIALIAIVLYWTFGSHTEDSQIQAEVKQADTSVKELPSNTPSGWVSVGGVMRAATDVAPAASRSSKDQTVPDVVLHGFSPPVSPEANPQAKQLFAALKVRSEPATYSSFAKAAPFDSQAYERDPDSYINAIEPGRVFSPAQPDVNVVAIRPEGSVYHGVVQGESVALRVRVQPRDPVTFTSFQLGSFENQLTSITVQADGEGIAQANFTASRGTIDDVQILAAGPRTSGQVQFLVNVRLAQP